MLNIITRHPFPPPSMLFPATRNKSAICFPDSPVTRVLEVIWILLTRHGVRFGRQKGRQREHVLSLQQQWAAGTRHSCLLSGNQTLPLGPWGSFYIRSSSHSFLASHSKLRKRDPLLLSWFFLATLRTPRIILFPAHTLVQTLNIKCMTLSSQQEHLDFNYLYSFKNTKFRWY